MTYLQWLNSEFLGNTMEQWLRATAVFVGVLLALMLVRGVLIGRVAAIAKRTSTKYDDLVVDLLVRTKFLFMAAMALVSAWSALAVTPFGDRLKEIFVVTALFVQAVIWANGVIGFIVGKMTVQQTEEGGGNVAIIRALGGAARVVVFAAFFLVALNELWEITPLIAGLGIGGIAIALAVQNILGDLFSAVTILVDKPFAVGDFIVVGTEKGTVEHIGLKSTRVRSLGGEQIIFSNADLLQSRIHNLRRMQERRIAFTTGVAYQTPNDVLVRIPQMIRTIVEAQERVRFDRCHFLKFADSWLEYETVFWVLDPDYITFADTQQKINLELHRLFGEEGIEFAYPTRTLFVENLSSDLSGEKAAAAESGGTVAATPEQA